MVRPHGVTGDRGGIVVSYESIRASCATFGPAYTRQLRRRQPRPGDKRHLDEVFIKVNGRMRYLWRAVDQDGNVLDILGNRQARHEGGEAVLSQAPHGS